MPQLCPTKVRFGYIANAGSPVAKSNEPNGTFFLLDSSVDPIQCVQLFLRQLWTMIGNDVESQTRVTEPALHMPLSWPTTNLATSSSAMFARKNGQQTTNVDICLIGYAWFRNVHFGTGPSVHEAINFPLFFKLVPKLYPGKNRILSGIGTRTGSNEKHGLHFFSNLRVSIC